MPHFNEKQLEESIIALLQEQGYEHVKGEAIERDLDEVVLRDDLRTYLRNRYCSDGITDTEVEAAIRVIVQKQGLSLYEENRHTMSLLMDGFSLKREDASKQNLFKKAADFRASMTRRVDTWDDFKVEIEKNGFLLCHWDGTQETEERIKEETKATIRCIPFDAPEEEGRCIYSGKPSHRRVVFARSY